jgi:hypothetical protein
VILDGKVFSGDSRLDLPTLADGGYEGAGIGAHTPVGQLAGNQNLDIDNRTYNAILRGLRGSVTAVDEQSSILDLAAHRAAEHGASNIAFHQTEIANFTPAEPLTL